jgi:1-deoxy-D-xylulose-5-phosphate reductoisomerase
MDDSSSPSAVTGEPRSVLVLGSTGSIGTQALDVIAENPDSFTVAGLAAGGSDPVALAEQALRCGTTMLAVRSADAGTAVTEALHARADGRPVPTVLAGPAAVTDLIDAAGADIVLNGITGSRGLEPTLRALATGATLALANKESLVAGGPLVRSAAAPGQLVPVDSEHSALAQCLRAGRPEEVARLVITASGGPFRGRTRDQLADVTVEQAMTHPTWNMGPVITVNSATMVNKALEVIEAHLLFDVPYDRIDVVVHPQSVIHSMVTFTDGATVAKASPPSMRLPIALALGWPNRVPNAAAACDWSTPTAWTFEPLDEDTFPAVRIARAAGTEGGCLPAVFNAANEEAVAAFFDGATVFTGIVDTIRRVLDEADQWRTEPDSVAEVLAAEQWARERARTLLAVGSTTGSAQPVTGSGRD